MAKQTWKPGTVLYPVPVVMVSCGSEEKGNITTYVNTRCVKITDKGIYVVDEKNEERFIEADTVVISAGSKIDKAKREIFKDVAFDVINIGDCYKVGDLQNAIHTAWDAATTL